MNFKIRLIVIFALMLNGLTYGQIRFSETIQTSKIANPDQNALYFIDFWATWCGPCVYANEYLEVLQMQYSDRFYVVSLSEENPDKVKRHLEKHSTDLAVSIDYDGETFKKHNIKVLPYGILLNAKGDMLWKGSPTDFKASTLEKFLRQNKVQAAFDDVFTIQPSEENQVTKDYIPKENFEINILDGDVNEGLEVSFKNHIIEYKGSLSDILANDIQVSKNQVLIDEDVNVKYHIYIYDNEELLPFLLSALDVDLSTSEATGEVLVIDNSEANFWNDNQIDWGNDSAKYLIDDNQIQADNVTFKEVLFQLSKILELPIQTTSAISETEVHDWIIHHKFFSLMQNDLSDNYGLKVEKKKASYKTYIVTKKTP